MLARTVSDKAAKVPAYNTVPCRTFALIELGRKSELGRVDSVARRPAYSPLDVVGNFLLNC